VQWFELLRNDWLIAALLAAVSLASLLLLPVIILALPADYFLSSRSRPLWREASHPVLFLLKNLFGLLLLALGFLMLVLPGQGLLTLFTGLVLLDFPGKQHVERWVAKRGKLLDAMNWLRARRGKAPLSRPPLG
jgi:hypothetical protein